MQSPFLILFRRKTKIVQQSCRLEKTFLVLLILLCSLFTDAFGCYSEKPFENSLNSSLSMSFKKEQVNVGADVERNIIRAGGLSCEKQPDAFVQMLVNNCSSDYHNEPFSRIFETSLHVLKYCTQVVAGVNYFVKVKSEKDEIFHLRIFKDLSDTILLTGIQCNKTESDIITYFVGFDDCKTKIKFDT